ncbi:unnamed protein product [Calypogeia fissa]
MAMEMMVTIMGGSILLPAVEAQVREAYCVRVEGGDAPITDAATLVQDLRLSSGQCCQTNDDCTTVLTFGNAAATLCSTLPGTPFCVSCLEAGDYVNQVLAQCVEQNLVQGVYDPDGSYTQLFYLTSASEHP